MDRVATVQDGILAVGPARYRAIVLPNLEAMDLEAMRRVLAFCQDGGTVVATRRLPTVTPGFLDGSKELHEIVTTLFGSSPKYGEVRHVGKGTAEFIENDRDAAQAVARRVEPSVKYSVRPTTVGFQHRRLGGRDIYFFANVGPAAVTLDIALNSGNSTFELWDAMSGEIRSHGNSKNVKIELPSRGSTFVVSGQTPGALPKVAESGRTEFIEVNGPWSLSFSGPDAPAAVPLNGLGSWTDAPGARFFSGLGTYTTTLDLKQTDPAHIFLSLGEVREAAEVRVNGVKCGTTIVPPFEVEVTNALRTGTNTISVTVANLPVNRFIGMPRPDMAPLRKIYGNRFPAPEEHDLMKNGPAPSGLLGPVRLRIVHGK